VNSLDARIVYERNDFRLEAELVAGAGEVVAVLGPNGAGKTTLLRILAGLASVSSGRVSVGDQVWDDTAAGTFVPATRRRAGFVFQDYRLFPHLTVLDNVAFPARARGARRRAARQDASALVQRLGLSDLALRRPGQLSGGQAQRVAIARALACDPRVLLLDEPLAALDARTRLDLRSDLRRQLTAFAGPSILVTHDQLDALVLADRIVVLEDGRIVQQGTAAQVASRPATQYVARLMGLNLYRGTVLDPATGRIGLDGGGDLYVAGSQEPAGSAVLVVVAPSAIALHVARPASSSVRNVWQGTVSGAELLTDRVRVAVTGSPGALADVTPAAVAELELAPGQPVWLSAKATEVTAYPQA
jgi:molybdate transport system ATP-binding protein